MSRLWTRDFWKETRDRATQTAAAAALGALGADAVVGFAGIDPVNINWQFVVATAILGAVVSILTSISSAALQRRNDSHG